MSSLVAISSKHILSEIYSQCSNQRVLWYSQSFMSKINPIDSSKMKEIIKGIIKEMNDLALSKSNKRKKLLQYFNDNRNNNDYYWNSSLYRVCQKGHIKAIEYLLKDNYVNEGLCIAGQSEKINEGLCIASLSENNKVINYLIKDKAIELGVVLIEGIYSEYIKLIKYSIRQGKFPIKLNDGLEIACSNGYVKVIKYFMKQGANDLNIALYGACESGHIKIGKYLIKKGAYECEYCYNSLHATLNDF